MSRWEWPLCKKQQSNQTSMIWHASCIRKRCFHMGLTCMCCCSAIGYCVGTENCLLRSSCVFQLSSVLPAKSSYGCITCFEGRNSRRGCHAQIVCELKRQLTIARLSWSYNWATDCCNKHNTKQRGFCHKMCGELWKKSSTWWWIVQWGMCEFRTASSFSFTDNWVLTLKANRIMTSRLWLVVLIEIALRCRHIQHTCILQQMKKKAVKQQP